MKKLLLLIATIPVLLFAEEKEITPPASPEVADPVGLYVTGDFLYWHMQQEGLSYAQSGFNGQRGTVKRPDFGFEPGFKVGLGYLIPHDDWDFLMQYTWIKSHVNDSSRGVRAKWQIANAATDTDFARAKSNWDIHINLIDVELGRNFYVSKFLSLRPFVGLKGAIINQDYNAKYFPENPSVAQVNQLQMRMEQNYWGVGVRGGINSSWHLSSRWSIYGNLALSGLWSQFDVDRVDRRTNLSNQTLTTANIRNDFSTGKPFLELALGLRWGSYFNQSRNHISLSAGWEQQIFWSHNQYISFINSSSLGDLTMQGLSAKIRFDF